MAALRQLAIAAALQAGACLSANPDFDGPADGSGEAGSHGSAASSGDSGSGDGMCEPDGFEPNEDASAEVVIGSVQVVLEQAAAHDRYFVLLPAGGPDQVTVSSGDADLRVCAFVRCEGTTLEATVTCREGLSGGSPDGYPGCCGRPTAALDFACDVDMGTKIYIDVSEGTADCTPYTLDVQR
ncbi:MAG: hypothetical protein K1X88_23225 [Nannocystaceae bacterium]|nr:hypothetical protein [Nannocystaceae bacterium]